MRVLSGSDQKCADDLHIAVHAVIHMLNLVSNNNGVLYVNRKCTSSQAMAASVCNRHA